MENQFSWTQQWYPISPISYLDPAQPTSVNLLGKKLVIWRDQNQDWVIMDDICPHKLARLSLGKINADGNLTCRHHGWCFNNQGKCTKIPMLAGSKAEENACKNERSQVTTYPTQIAQDLLWVWPDPSLTAFTDSISIVFIALALLLILVNMPVQLAIISIIMAVVSSLIFYLLDDLRYRFLSSVPNRGIPLVRLF